VSEPTHLQSEDLQSSGGFDKNEIVDLPSFTDKTTIALADIQRILLHTPYGRASFLSTYSSNGVRADDAVIAASQKYGINPIVFLVRAEMDQGLLGEQFYPAPPSRVEYVFGCGCSAPGSCDPALAGFDVQVDCFGHALKTSLDEVAANGATAGGFGPMKTAKTLDGDAVTPADASTAALYQYTPIVGKGSSGNWLFWNIWQEYAGALVYVPPTMMGP
jgi:hypothetical protein